MSLFTQGNAALQEIERAMQAIGYRGELLRRNYRYTDVTASDNEVHTNTIDIAGFAQTQPTYRNACIGVIVSNGLSGAPQVAQHRALGAPLIFEIDGTIINRWKVTVSGGPELKESIPYNNIVNAFNYHEPEWSPESILTAKAIGEIRGPIQLDFYDESLMPFLEGKNFEKLDYLLREVLTKAIQIYKKFNNKAPRFLDLFPLAFRFIAAKVFRDRGYPGGWASNDATTALQAIEKHYNTRPGELPPSVVHRQEVLDAIWDIILSTFNFPNLSEDDLALVFEKTFITPETRRTLGIHSTPLRVAEYIIRKLPLEELTIDDCYVLEPFAGHGRFLVAALRRLHDRLPAQISDVERHNYFQQHLVGIELDRRSIEVCRLSLTLADSPNPNGWQLYNEDVFKTGTLERELKRAQIVLCNPPFENFTFSKRNEYNDPNLLIQKPAETLRRILLQPPALIGLVLPRVFESGRSYKSFHRQLAETYSNIELVALPKVFNYSDADTMLVIASGRRSYSSQTSITCRKVGEGSEREAFLTFGIEPPAAKTSVSAADYSEPEFSLWIPPLSRIWSYLRSYPTLETIAEIHRGLMWLPASDKRGKKIDKYVSDTPKAKYAEGYVRAEGILSQYHIDRRALKYLSLRPQDQSRNAYEYEWNLPKVVCNASRLSRGPWRVAAVADSRGLTFSSRFVALWPSKEISIFALTALLNSPLCNAFFYAKEAGSLNRLITFKALPIPPSNYLMVGGEIDSLSRFLHKQLARNSTEIARDILLRLDAEILRAYDLPPLLEREVLDIFQGKERPVPVQFTSHYPRNLEVYVPLHEFISPTFERAVALPPENIAAIQLLDSWLIKEPQGQSQEWERLEQSIDENRLSSRKFFT